MASTSTNEKSNVDANNDDDVFFELTREHLIIVVKYLISNY